MKARILAMFVASLATATVVNAADVNNAASAAPQASVASSAQATEKANLNTADVAQLMQALPSLSKKHAKAIVSYREKHGNFKAVEDLANVKGFSHKFVKNHLDKLQNAFTVG